MSGTIMGIDELDRLVGELGVEGWCRPAERRLLYHLARYGPGAGAIVEIGTWNGLSTLYLAAGSKAAQRERVTAIDRFPYGTMTALHRNLLLAGVHDWVTPIAADSRAAAMAWHGPAIRLLFLDGDHTYDGVRGDYAAWQALVAPGGLVAFHDALEPNWPDVSRFLDEVLPGGDWAACAIADPALSAVPDGADPVANTIVVAQRSGPGVTPLAVPGGYGPFTTIRLLVERLREPQPGRDPEDPVRARRGPARPSAGHATYDHMATLEAQFYAVEEYALELEERLDALQAAYERVATSARALDGALRAANPIKSRLRHLGRLITRARIPGAS